MEISTRKYLTAGLSLTAATAIAFAPLPIPTPQHPPAIPNVTVSDVRLTADPTDIAVVIAGLQDLLDDASVTAGHVAGIPGRFLIEVVDTIVRLIDVGFTRLIDATHNPTAAATRGIMKTLSYDAFARLAENLGRINHVNTTTTEQVAKLLTSALTGSLQNMLIGSYANVFTAGIASGQLLVGNGLQSVQKVGDAWFDVVGIAVDEVTFQLNNLISEAGTLLTHLGDASGPIVEAAFRAVRGLVLAPTLAVVNVGSGLVKTVLTVTNAGFDLVLDTATTIVGPTAVDRRSTVTTNSRHATNDVAPQVDSAPVTDNATAEESTASSEDVVPMVDETDGDDESAEAVDEDPDVDEGTEQDAAGDVADEAAADDDAVTHHRRAHTLRARAVSRAAARSQR